MSDNKRNAVAYVDGSCKPNPSVYWSAGWHGYIYNTAALGTKSGDVPLNNVISNRGYLEKEIIAGVTHQTVVPELYFNGYSKYDVVGSNNTGEIMGIVVVIEELLKLQGEEKISHLLIKSDSKYALGIVKTIQSGADWRNAPRPNEEYWQLMEETLEKAKQAGLELELIKVAGHSTSIGNHLSDRQALLGRLMATKKVSRDTVFKYTDAKRYWKPKDEKHPFLQYKKLFFLGNQTSSYAVMSYKKDVEPGKKSHEAAFGLAMLNEPIDRIEKVKRAYNTNLAPVSIISAVDMDALYSQDTVIQQDLYGDDAYTFNNKGRKSMSILEDQIVVTEVYPPGLANRALEKVLDMERYIKEYLNGGGMSTMEDVTSEFFTQDAKGKTVVTLDNIVKTHNLKSVTKEGKEITIPLELGKDIISRNQMRKLEKLEPVVTLTTLQVSPKYIEYYIIIETKANKDISIWCNLFSNNVIVPN